MNNKNTVAAILAVFTMAIFLGVFVFLAFGKIDPVNKDFFNTALIALISCVSTAFGYYLGSSVGSAQKNEILAQVMADQTDASPPTPTLAKVAADTEGGFARLPLLFILSILFIVSFCLTGCATTTKLGVQDKPETPQSIAAKTLLTTRQGIIGAATAIDAVCSQGLLKQAECTKGGKLYDQAKAIWPGTADAFLLYLVAGDVASKEKYDEVQLRLDGLFTNLSKITATFQGGK